MSVIEQTGVVSISAYSAIPVCMHMNAMSAPILAVTPNEKNRHNYRKETGERGKPAGIAISGKLMG